MFERFCVRDRVPIPPERAVRGSCFCSNECRRLDKIDRRKAKAEKFCRLCGRKKPSVKVGPSVPANVAPDGGATVAHASVGGGHDA